MKVHFDIDMSDFGAFRDGDEVPVVCKQNHNESSALKLHVSAKPEEVKFFTDEDNVHMVQRTED